MTTLKNRLINYYTENEQKLNIYFFIGGIIFDFLTLSEIDSLASILQQIFYISSVGYLLYLDFLSRYAGFQFRFDRLNKLWVYRDAIIHFLMGGMLNMYSLFFLKSASIMSSFVFLGFMLGMIVANELQIVKENKISLKIALYFICVFSFFAILFPLGLGFVGFVPFSMAFVSTLFFVYFIYKIISKRIPDRKVLGRSLVLPSLTIINLFLIFYVMGWIPPVPLSVQELGIYHNVEKSEYGDYVLYSEKPWWKFWQSGDQEFLAQTGDSIFVFVRIFSPTRFNDSVTLHWQLYNEKRGWLTTDKIKMKISGGRKEGFRGYAFKQNYQEGDWRVLVETNDGHEIGRQSFWVSLAGEINEDRKFETETR